MIDIHFEIGGRRVNPRNTRDALEAAMFGAVEDGIRKTRELAGALSMASLPN